MEEIQKELGPDGALLALVGNKAPLRQQNSLTAAEIWLLVVGRELRSREYPILPLKRELRSYQESCKDMVVGWMFRISNLHPWRSSDFLTLTLLFLGFRGAYHSQYDISH